MAGRRNLATRTKCGSNGDERTYERAVALRAVTSTDAMTADWAHLPYEFMAKVSNDIINKVKGVNRVCYDISSNRLPQLSGNNRQPTNNLKTT